MYTKTKRTKGCRLFLPLIFSIFLSFYTQAQTERAVNGEMAICKISVNEKGHILKPNNIGYFNRLPGIKPLQTLPVEIIYPDANPGDKIIVTVKDGGTLDNGKAMKILYLDNEKKISFGFQVAKYTGIYRVTVKKGNDIKVVQFWVDE